MSVSTHHYKEGLPFCFLYNRALLHIHRNGKAGGTSLVAMIFVDTSIPGFQVALRDIHVARCKGEGARPNAHPLENSDHSRFREAFGNVVIEAALARKPVVASNVDGIAETVIDGETGFLVDCTEPIKSRTKGTNRYPGAVVDGRTRELRPPYLPNIEILAEKVITCLQDPELAAALGHKAYLRATSIFSVERYRTELDNLYRELISGQ